MLKSFPNLNQTGLANRTTLVLQTQTLSEALTCLKCLVFMLSNGSIEGIFESESLKYHFELTRCDTDAGRKGTVIAGISRVTKRSRCNNAMKARAAKSLKLEQEANAANILATMIMTPPPMIAVPQNLTATRPRITLTMDCVPTVQV